MANYRRRRSRRRFNLRRVRVAGSSTIGALASLDVLIGTLTNTSPNPYRIMSVDLSWALVDLGATSDDGQEFGLSHSDYSSAEVEECLEAQGMIDQGNKLAQEQGNRLVRSIGFMTESPGTGAGMGFNNGVALKTKLNWAIGIGDTLNVWVRNGSGTVYTTGASLVTLGNIWIKDGL